MIFRVLKLQLLMINFKARTYLNKILSVRGPYLFKVLFNINYVIKILFNKIILDVF